MIVEDTSETKIWRYMDLSKEHEKELRATILLPQTGRGAYVPCNLDVLISQIHVSPFAPDYFKEVVSSICAGQINKLEQPVRRSKLLDDPDYGRETYVGG